MKQTFRISTLASLFVFMITCLQAQELNKIDLHRSFQLAKKNYPLIKQQELIEKSKNYSVANANKGFLPQILINGTATYQSDVTQLPISLPNVQIDPLPKDQYRVYAEVAQPITDLFTIKDQRNYAEATAGIENQKVEVELFKIKERIQQLYFAILLIDAQTKQTDLMKSDIQRGIEQVEVAIKNGISTRSNLHKLQAELLKANQRSIEFSSNRKGYLSMLSQFIGQPIAENCILEFPEGSSELLENHRPELQLIELQQKSMNLQNNLLKARNLPRFSAFLQGGLGRPGLNMLDPSSQGFYIAGLRMQWNIAGLYTYANDKRNIEINKSLLEQQKETFLFNSEMNMLQQNSEIDKIHSLIVNDDEIINLREQVKKATHAQLKNGIATSNDYMLSVTEEDQARQNKILHQVQLMMAKQQQQLILGN